LLSFFPAGAGFPGRSVIQALISLPEGVEPVSGSPDRSLSFLKPCDPIVERTFPIFSDLLNILNRGSFVQTSALLMCRPEGLNEQDRASLKKPFPVPHHLSSLLSLI
jgi:hypothetical protein